MALILNCKSDCNPLTGCDVCCPPRNNCHIWGWCPICNSANIEPDYGHGDFYDKEAYHCKNCNHWWQV